MSVASDLAAAIRSLLAPRPEQTVTAWAEQNVYLPSSVTQNAGQYSTAHCAYIRELLEDFRNPFVTESVNCFAAQVFKTTGVFVGIAYRIDQQPANIIMVLSRAAKRASPFEDAPYDTLVVLANSYSLSSPESGIAPPVTAVTMNDAWPADS